MAQFNEVLVGRFNAVLQKLFSMKGGAPAPQLAPEIQPVVVLEADRVEWEYLAGGRLCSAAVTIPAVAAKLSVAQLRNPATSNVLAVVEQIFVSSSKATADLLKIGFGYPASDLAQLPAAGEVVIRDGRFKLATSKPACAFTFDQGPPAVIAANLLQINAAPQAVLTYDNPLIVSPGAGVQIYSATVNNEIYVAIAWRERTMQASELI